MNLINEETFYRKAKIFLEEIFLLIKESKVDIRHWSIDHICYRVESLDRYESCKKQLSSFSKLLIESEVNGRPISTFKLSEPIKYKERFIDLVELPAPKPGKITAEGFEHIEIITKNTFQEIINENPNCFFDTSSLEKNFNQELKLKLNKYQVKFHYQSLESVINLEENNRVFSALKSSKVLETLKDLAPLIAGTFPLGIFQDKSDLDIITSASDLEIFRDQVKSHYKNKDKFLDKICEVRGEKSYVAYFEENGVPIEIFAQSNPSAKQTAYQHYQIEEQFLKVGSKKFFSTIKELRKKGEKTEPAFAKALNISGDPYDELLELNNKTDQSIYDFLKGINEEYV